ncbi:unnamed protein product [Phyllotreta striolata]|uniref:Uncharacterized protein n=1 Tax=Phyllotreta striolata TaxID=444603 RepID=A0A9N9TRB6_PHYSR|nr:unnamed protein product [Phyllotreta striolata]
MERIIKVKTKIDRIPRSSSPSERRYSASMVLGLSVVFLGLFAYTAIMGTIIIYKLTVQPYANLTDANIVEKLETRNFTIENNSTILQEELAKLYDKVDRDLDLVLEGYKRLEIMLKRNSDNYFHYPALICCCFLMAVGHLNGFILGILAWKRWYIDRNITLFFVAAVSSTIFAALGLVLSIVTCFNLKYDYDTYVYEVSRANPITFSLVLNIAVASTVGLIWSSLAAKISYKGMRSEYPDDGDLGNAGKTDICVGHPDYWDSPTDATRRDALPLRRFDDAP